MNTPDNKNVLSGSEISKRIDKAKESIKARKYKEASQLLLEAIEADQNDEAARGLVSQLNKRQRIRNFRIFLIAIFLVTAMTIAYLGWEKVHSTEVAISLTADQFSFTLEEKWDLNSIAMDVLGISNISDFELYPLSVERAIKYNPDTDQPIEWQKMESRTPFRIDHNANFWNVLIRSKYLVLSQLSVDSGSTVTIADDKQNPNKVRMSIAGGAVFGTVETSDTLMLTCNNCVVGNHSIKENNSLSHDLRIITQHREIEFTDLNKSIDLIFEIPWKQDKSHQDFLAEKIEINSIDFTRFEKDARESTLLGGKVSFAELDGKEWEIKQGDFLVVSGLCDFQIKRLCRNQVIGIYLYGKVHELKSGAQAFLYSRLPTYLEWLRANQSLTLFLATLIPVFSTLLAIFYRLKIIKYV